MLSLGSPVQIGWVVKDLDIAMLEIGSVLGVVEWTVRSWPDPARPQIESWHRAMRSPGWKARMAVADLESIQIELVEPTEGASAYSEWFAAHGQSVHHMMYRVEDVPRPLPHFHR